MDGMSRRDSQQLLRESVKWIVHAAPATESESGGFTDLIRINRNMCNREILPMAGHIVFQMRTVQIRVEQGGFIVHAEPEPLHVYRVVLL